MQWPGPGCAPQSHHRWRCQLGSEVLQQSQRRNPCDPRPSDHDWLQEDSDTSNLHRPELRGVVPPLEAAQ
eukprot:6485416-Amphidinium_carterae.1